MTTVLETYDEASASTVMTSALATSERRRLHRCPECGHVEHTNSELAGTCVLCPGLVELEPA